MMNVLRNLYRDFFKLNEQTTPVKTDPNKGIVSTKDPKKAEELAKKGVNVNLTEDEIEEAKLINNITDYRGGVVYAINDPSQAKEVSADIRQWAEKKGFDVIKQTVSNDGRSGYFYFRLGEDPEKDSQRIQGYFSSRLELKAFKFKVRGEQEPQQPTEQPIVKRSLRKI